MAERQPLRQALREHGKTQCEQRGCRAWQASIDNRQPDSMSEGAAITQYTSEPDTVPFFTTSGDYR